MVISETRQAEIIDFAEGGGGRRKGLFIQS